MKFMLFAVLVTLASANPALKKTYARDSSELHQLGVRQDCSDPSCNGGCGPCAKGSNVCCPFEASVPCYVYSC
ncbi:hypothetical protein LZ31DRAFT_557822 [Colletotrichum somersetense]|nr:hypothetical protein LZ31DRAFT_557822 [Colletotrichum somersetense]